MLTPSRLLTLGAMVLFVVWLLLFRPTYLGGPATYVIVNGKSMEPTFYTGDLAMVRQQDSYAVGDIVAFEVESSEGYRVADGGIVIHRIISGSAPEGFVMQGKRWGPWCFLSSGFCYSDRPTWVGRPPT